MATRFPRPISRRMRYLHTMIRVTDPDATIAFFELLGLRQVRRMDSEKGRFSLIDLVTNTYV